MVDPIETGEVAGTDDLNHRKSHPALNQSEARQGSRQKLNFRVLVISLAICAFAGAIIYFQIQ